MAKTGLQKLALVSIVFLLIIILAGAVVRVTGSGLGCPDWPTCWGKLIPPTSDDQVDMEVLGNPETLNYFKRRAERWGRNPEDITPEKLLTEFDPLETWIEYLNRLITIFVGFAALALVVASIRSKRYIWLCLISLLVVAINAFVGKLVVDSELRARIVTIHMALAFLQLFILTYLYWAGGRKGQARDRIPGPGRPAVMVLLACVMIEWAMGSQIREVTDKLMREYGVESRSNWIKDISGSLVYLVHRSFSWSILIAALWLGYRAGWKGTVPRMVLALVGALMVMGVILSQSGIHAVVQVLHVGTAGILVSVVYYWWLAADVSGKEGEGVS